MGAWGKQGRAVGGAIWGCGVREGGAIWVCGVREGEVPPINTQAINTPEVNQKWDLHCCFEAQSEACTERCFTA